MKKLNLLKPELKTGYLNYGKGEAVTFLKLNGDINKESLKNDIKNGAVQFGELLEFSKKKPSQFVVVNCDNKEDGLMAVSYLAEIYNEKENNAFYDDEESISEKDEMNFDDFFFLDEEESGEDAWQNSYEWEEDSSRIPVLTAEELCHALNRDMVTSFNGDMGFGAIGAGVNKQPYWYSLRRESVCVLIQYGFSFNCSQTELIKALARFKNNKHVYIIYVNEESQFDFDEDDCPFGSADDICELVLEYTAGTFDVTCEKSLKNNYYGTVFENWVDNKGYSLSKGFPKAKMVNRILAFNNPCKSELTEKVIDYVIKEFEEPRALTEKDFNILTRFKSLGVAEEENEHLSIKKLENSLIGMEDVKEQIRGVVEIMKYNKSRKEFGFDDNGYHNIHMLLGAPGTAKTTVAQLLGAIMAEEKLIKSNRFISVNGAELKGKYVGHSAPKVKALFENYDIILIDEAYAVAAGSDGDTDSFSQEAIAQLLVELENHGMDKLVLFAGYGGKNVSEKDNKMKVFLQANPGIRSRINSTIYFDSYSPDQMADIFFCHAKNGNFIIDKAEEDEVRNMVKKHFATRVADEDFGNGREARALLENTTMEAAKRIAKLPEKKRTKKVYQMLSKEDIAKAIDKQKEGFATQKGKKNVVKFGFVS